MDANCQVCGRPVHFAERGRGTEGRRLVHVEPLAKMVVTKDEVERVMENAKLNAERTPPDRIYGLILHQPIKEKE